MKKLEAYVTIYRTCREHVEKLILDEELSQTYELPFWYHCDCGGKLRLHRSISAATYFEGVCPVCAAPQKLMVNQSSPKLAGIIKRTSPDAVLRNILLALGLGTNVYVVGAGGGLVYGEISSKISDGLGIPIPMYIGWRSQDRYVSVIVQKWLKRLMATQGVALEQYQLLPIKLEPCSEELQAVNRAIAEYDLKLQRLKQTLKSHKPEEAIFTKIVDELRKLQQAQRKFIRKKQQLDAIRRKYELLPKLQYVTPSIIDGFLSLGFHQLLKAWIHDLQINEFDLNHAILIDAKRV
jgi:hypothetical protein